MRPVFSQQYIRRLQIPVAQPGGVNGSQCFGHTGAQHPHTVEGEGLALAKNLLKRRSSDKGGHHPWPFGVRVSIDNLCGVEAADLPAGLYLQGKPPPELDVIGVSGIDQLDRDGAPGLRAAEEHLAHPARPKTTEQNIVPDSPRISCPKGIHATLSPQGSSGRSEPARTR